MNVLKYSPNNLQIFHPLHQVAENLNYPILHPLMEVGHSFNLLSEGIIEEKCSAGLQEISGCESSLCCKFEDTDMSKLAIPQKVAIVVRPKAFKRQAKFPEELGRKYAVEGLINEAKPLVMRFLVDLEHQHVRVRMSSKHWQTSEQS